MTPSRPKHGGDRPQPDRKGVNGGNGEGDDSRNSFSRYAPYLSLGLEIALGVTVPILIGFYLDRWLGTGPWLLLLGIAAGMFNIFMLIYRLYKNLDNL